MSLNLFEAPPTVLPSSLQLESPQLNSSTYTNENPHISFHTMSVNEILKPYESEERYRTNKLPFLLMAVALLTSSKFAWKIF